MKLFRVIAMSNKEPTDKNVCWLDTRNGQYKLKFWRDFGWADIYRDLHLNPDDYLSKLDASRLYQPKGTYVLPNQLLRYYTKEETYSKEEIDTLVHDVVSFEIKVVEELPEIGEKNTIYLVPSKQSKDNTIYSDTLFYDDKILINEEEFNSRDEYLWINDKWELIGTTKLDLTNYATKDWVESKNYLDSIPEEYITEEELEAKGYLTEHQDISGKQDKLVSGVNIKTINNNSILGKGNIEILTTANDVLFTSDLTITAPVGVHTIPSQGYKILPTTGKSVKQVMDMLFASEKNPTITQPYVNITLTGAGAKEAGTNVTPSYTASLNSGSYQYGPATGVTATSWTITDTNGGSKNTASGSFNQFQVTDSTNYTITAQAQHTEGAIPLTNLGNNYTAGKILAGTKSKTSSSITSYRNSFYGTVTSKDSTIDSSLIRSLSGKSNRNLTNGATFNINIPIGALRVIIAYPDTLRDLTQVLDSNAFDSPITGEFTKNKITVLVEGANGYTAKSYKVFYMDYANPNDTVNTYKVTI